MFRLLLDLLQLEFFRFEPLFLSDEGYLFNGLAPDELGDRALRFIRSGRFRIGEESVEPFLHLEIFDRGVRRSERIGIQHAVIPKRIVLRSDDQRGGEAAVVFGEQRREVRIERVFRFALVVVDIERHLSIGQGGGVFILCVTGGPHPAVGNRVDQDLAFDRRSFAIPRQTADHRGKVSSGAVADEEDSIGVVLPIAAAGGGPQKGVVAIFDGGRKAVLRRKAVIDGKNCGSGDIGQVGADDVVEIHVPPHPAATMVVDDQGQQVADSPRTLFFIQVAGDFSIVDGNHERLGGDVSRRSSEQPANQHVGGKGHSVQLGDPIRGQFIRIPSGILFHQLQQSPHSSRHIILGHREFIVDHLNGLFKKHSSVVLAGKRRVYCPHMKTYTRFGYDFITEPFLPEGKDEYYLRFEQNNKDPDSYRNLRSDEIAILRSNLNHSPNWDNLLVRDPFDPRLIRNSEFYGLVRLGTVSMGTTSFHDFTVPVGIVNSRIVSCDIGDSCSIMECTYLSHYIIDDEVVLYRIGEMQSTNHAKFGNGIVKDGEDPEVLITIDVVNEAKGRSIRPFDGMIPADAFLWSTYREDRLLMQRFNELTDKVLDTRRGYYGFVGRKTVIKSCDTIKDVWIGEGAYIKGANKLKNLTMRSTLAEPVQIGEGVELVNGIIGSGSRIFYGSKAIRFVMGDNSNLKYGARLIHSVLGDNSTVSCCEILNSLIFGSHEQHHNNSFLIAARIEGQSNMAAGANLGSNHNSRNNDGEMIARRGFWPALSTTVTYDSYFASYTLIAKGSFPYQLSVPLPFSLISSDEVSNRRVVMGAYWWMYNLYALERNTHKHHSRDKRKTPRQRYEAAYLAPDTTNEIIAARGLLELWVGESLGDGGMNEESLRSQGKSLLLNRPELVERSTVTTYTVENSKEPVIVLKAVESYRAYAEMLLFYAMKTLIAYASSHGRAIGDLLQTKEARLSPWENVGGQLVRRDRMEALIEQLKEGAIRSWEEVHQTYSDWENFYEEDTLSHALGVLSYLLEKKRLTERSWDGLVDETTLLVQKIEQGIYHSKEKDYLNHFKYTTYRNEEERNAVLGNLEDDQLIKTVHKEMETFLDQLNHVSFSRNSSSASGERGFEK